MGVGVRGARAAGPAGLWVFEPSCLLFAGLSGGGGAGPGPPCRGRGRAAGWEEGRPGRGRSPAAGEAEPGRALQAADQRGAEPAEGDGGSLPLQPAPPAGQPGGPPARGTAVGRAQCLWGQSWGTGGWGCSGTPDPELSRNRLGKSPRAAEPSWPDESGQRPLLCRSWARGRDGRHRLYKAPTVLLVFPL